MKTVNEIKAQINKLQAQVYAIENGIRNKYTPLFIKEVRNFLAGVGKGFVNGDYYAPDRYYSDIYFIKNIRCGQDYAIEVKLLSPAGELLPSEIEIDGITYQIVLNYSKNYTNEIDY